MKTKEEYFKKATKGLLPINTRCVITYAKSDDFYEQGIIVAYFQKSNGFFWDYKILLDNNKVVYFDKHSVDIV